MVDTGTKQEKNGWSPTSAAAWASFSLVLLGAVLVTLGFVSTSEYYGAMGLPPGSFPPESALLGAMGFVYGVPAIFIVALPPLIGWLGWIVGKTERLNQSKIFRCIMSGIMLVSAIGLCAPRIYTPPIWFPDILALLFNIVLVFSSGAVLAVLPSKSGVGFQIILYFLIVVALAYFVIVFTAGIAAYWGRQYVAEIEEPQFSTVILEGEILQTREADILL